MGLILCKCHSVILCSELLHPVEFLSASVGKKFNEIEEIRRYPGLQPPVAAPIAGTADLVSAEGDFPPLPGSDATLVLSIK